MIYCLLIKRPGSKSWSRIGTFSCGTTDRDQDRAIAELTKEQQNWQQNGGDEYFNASYKIVRDWDEFQRDQDKQSKLRLG